ncbi:MAG: ribonuclease J [Deltaproteobacteria bacterium]|nr:ribonuclease J [Deltaproteobacteria bacterium]
MTRNANHMRIIPLGGLGEIGMNCMAIEVEGRLLVVDCGAMFPSETLGLELIVPGFEYLASRRGDLEGVVITHGHEDHIGGLPYLLREVDVPIYSSPYPAGLLKEKFKEHESEVAPHMKILAQDGSVVLGPFAVRAFAVPHSIVESMGFAIDTPAGRVLHTGDFKLGLKGEDRGQIALARFAEAAAGGVDLLISDSTGSEEEEPAGDERSVADCLTRLVRKVRGRVFVAIFSSNVQRLRSILDVARATGRKASLCGRSVETHARVAASTGALKLPPDLMVPEEEVMDLQPERTLAVLSGTQGELRSALGRLSEDAHRNLHVERGDAVLLSSRFIPGNEVAISQTIDRLLRLGAQVFHRGNEAGIHVSGHGGRQEIRMVVEAVRPRAFLPSHGTLRHLTAAAALAREAGVPSVSVIVNGQVARVGPSGLTVEERPVPARKVHIDPGGMLTEAAVRDRRVLAAHGVLVISWVADTSGRANGPVLVTARGVAPEESMPWLAGQVAAEVGRILEAAGDERTDTERCRELVRSGLRKFLSKLVSREPYVLVVVHAPGAGRA